MLVVLVGLGCTSHNLKNLRFSSEFSAFDTCGFE